MPVIKCRECNAPMNETRKGRPEKLPENVKWILCRQCNKGIELIMGESEPQQAVPAMTIQAKNADKMDFEEKVTITHYITITKITGENNEVLVTKETFSDPERKILIKQEKL
jgi:hypothetical protein